MVVIGINEGRTKGGIHLHDGGCVVVRDGRVIAALSEERVTRRKRSGGYNASLSMIRKELDINPKDVDLIVTSSCCEDQLSCETPVHGFERVPIISCNHHLSHAYSAFWTSPFESAIVIVLDAGGNTLGSYNDVPWWLCKREQHSYFRATSERIELIGSDFEEPQEAGIGEVYRAFTHYLGWPSSRFSGNTMALSGFGNCLTFQNCRIFDERDGRMISNVHNNPGSPLKMVEELLSNCGSEVQLGRDGVLTEQTRADLAAWIQAEMEAALIKLVDSLIVKTGIQKICFAGGVAYNCKGIFAVMKNSMAKNVFVGPASGDHGQALGNSIYGYMQIAPNNRKVFSVLPPYLGPAQDLTHEIIVDSIKALGLPLMGFRSDDVIVDGARLLVNGAIIGWFQGKSEFGPRALGNRSILASPRVKGIKHRLNEIKGREIFMPLAPAVLEDRASLFFEAGGTSHMTVAVDTLSNESDWMNNIKHIDGSARVQIVRRENNDKFYGLIEEFYRITNIPMVLNTSFNGAGEPIVERVVDALESFDKLALDYLVIGNTIVSKEGSQRTMDIKIGEGVYSSVPRDSIWSYLSKAIPQKNGEPRNRFLLFRDYIQWLRTGRKSTTIRYRRGAIDYPSDICLPLLETEDFSDEYIQVVGKVVIHRLEIKRYGELDEEDAVKDGFSCLSDLQNTITTIYGPIGQDELVSIYSFKLVDSH